MGGGAEPNTLFEVKPEGVVLRLRVVPRASRSKLLVEEAGLRLRLAAPPVEGAANTELVRYLAKFFGMPKSAVTLVSGERSKSKRVLLAGASPDEVQRLLGGLG
ncbi:MAG TPA: DUF167 domain-containing protein [Acidobacteriota bacterium]|nr:DUF167 domain-containing protein [Acidobacteriota bacterium]